jgi:predicted phosphodiesterase
MSMRVALLSDIHGNAVALEAVLHDLHRDGITSIVCLGDSAEAGPQPRQVLQRLRALGCPTVLGNTDEQLLTRQFNPPRDADTPKVNAIAAWCAEQLTVEDQQFLQALPLSVQMPLPDGQALLGFHGSPHAHTDFLDATTPEAVLDRWFADTTATILTGGHTHRQLLRRYHACWIVNPGSVGLPYVRSRTGQVYRPTWAEYAVIESRPGHLSIDLRHTPVTRAALEEMANSSDMPEAAWWLKDWRVAR